MENIYTSNLHLIHHHHRWRHYKKINIKHNFKHTNYLHISKTSKTIYKKIWKYIYIMDSTPLLIISELFLGKWNSNELHIKHQNW